MKGYNKLWALALIPMLAGCADDFDTTSNFEVDKPESITQYEYLNAYNPLKTYVDRTVHEGFLLGTGVNAQEYLKKGGVYQLTNSNFDQVTTGNAMKYGSIVGDDGTMNFSTVIDFVDAATAAGLEVYGHTLCWHSQQNTKWLKTLLADKEIVFDPNDRQEVVDYSIDFTKESGYSFWNELGDNGTITTNATDGLEIVNNVLDADNWHFQYFIADNLGLEKGKAYTLKMQIKGSDTGTMKGVIGGWSDNAGFTLEFTPSWTEETIDFVAADNNGHILAQTGAFVGTINIKSIKVVHYEAPVSEVEVVEERRCIEVSSDDKVDAAWDTQFWIMTDATFNEGDTWELSMNIRADKAAASSTQVHTEAGSYLHYEGVGNPNFTRSWTEYTANGTFPGGAQGGHSIAFNLNEFAEANNYYFDDISFKVNGVELIKNSTCDDDNVKVNFIAKEKRGDVGPARFVDRCKNVIASNTQPLTPEEKCEILTAEMERWIKGMMEATGGKVKAWDVVNEPLAGSGSPYYGLQTGATDPGNFYWQDYLGDDYVRVPIKFARQYFKEFGGNPEELKLFINDYNLESTWDDNKKAKSLVEYWIPRWQKDGTVIDGIGTQMHVSYNVDLDKQKEQEDHIVKMFEILKESGKLIRITELDMGILDENGKAIKTPDVTYEQKLAMAGFYKFIVKKYFEIIPKAQQYGICAWAQTDSPEGSGWRGGEPIGLWDENLSRKPAYAGFADGLAGKE